MENIIFNTHPAILHGNGLSKLTLNSFTNYIPNKWSLENGCTTCHDNTIDLSTFEVFYQQNNCFHFIYTSIL